MQNVFIYFVVALPEIIIETHMMACWKAGVVLNPSIPSMLISHDKSGCSITQCMRCLKWMKTEHWH